MKREGSHRSWLGYNQVGFEFSLETEMPENLKITLDIIIELRQNSDAKILN